MMKGSKRRVGIMGGTFDPIHYGHLMAAEEARVALALDCVLFLPTGTPPHKHYEGMASAEDRYAMTLLATLDNPFFDVLRIETERGGKSYTRDTLAELRALYPEADFFLIAGLDSILDMPNWLEPLEICRLCTPVAVTRPGYGKDKLTELPSQILEKLYTLDTVMPDISATDIRERAGRGASIRYRVPPEVETYIAKHCMYANSGGEKN